MRCEEFSPSPLLLQYIKSYIIIEDEDGDIRNQTMNIYPSGHLEMIISFGDRVIFSQDDFILRTAAGYLGGQILEPVYYQCTGKMRILSVIFRPFGIYRFLNIPQCKFNGRRIDLDLIMGRSGKEFISRLCEEPSREGKIIIADRFFLGLLHNIDFRDPRIARASFVIDRSFKKINISHLCSKLNISIKTLERDFRRIVGISPKELARVIRFNRAFNAINSAEPVDVQEIIYDCGYYDQAHFINEFKRFTSLTPTSFLYKKEKSVEKSFREVVKI